MDLEETFEWRGRLVAWGRSGSGPPVVLCHGTPFSSRVWAPFAEALSEDRTVYAWDMPGYGASSKDPGHPVDFGFHGELLADLLRAWELDAPDLVAHDFGGATALRAHLLHGADLRSLMLVDVVAIPPTGSPFFRLVREHPGVLPELPAYVHRAVVERYVQDASHRGLRPDDLDALVAPWLGEEGQPAFYRQIEQTSEHFLAEVERELHRIAIPVRIVWGTEDAWIPVATADRLRGLIPGETLRRIPGAGHLVHYDQPAALADAIRVWLSSIA